MKNIPKSMRERKQWIRWRLKPNPDKSDKPDKIPLDPTGKLKTNFGVNFVNILTDFDTANNSKIGDGIGFVFTPNDSFCFIDIDMPIADCHKWINYFNSYTEISLNGRCHIFIETLPIEIDKANPHPHEIYFSGRWVALTGDVFGGRNNISKISAAKLKEYCVEVGHINKRSPGRPSKMQQLWSGVSKGNRHEALISLTGQLLNRRLTEDEALDTMLDWNLRNDPPFSEKEVETQVKDCYARYNKDGFLDPAVSEIFNERPNIFMIDAQIYDIQEPTLAITKVGLWELALNKDQLRILSYALRQRKRNFGEGVEILRSTTHRLDLPLINFDGYSIEIFYPIVKFPEKNHRQLIHEYMDWAFGEYKDFMMLRLAQLYTTNHRSAGVIIIISDRGFGKNFLIDLIRKPIDNRLVSMAQEGERNFSEREEKKLIILSEFLNNDLKFYMWLKSISGDPLREIEKKYRSKYMTRNNLNVFIITNEKQPFFPKQTEAPGSDEDNQFFVYELPEKINKRFNKEQRKQIQDGWIDFVWNEIMPLAPKLDDIDARFTIRYPITPALDRIFREAYSELDDISWEIAKKYYESNDKPKGISTEALRALIYNEEKYRKEKTLSVVRSLQRQGALAYESKSKKTETIYAFTPEFFKIMESQNES